MGREGGMALVTMTCTINLQPTHNAVVVVWAGVGSVKHADSVNPPRKPRGLRWHAYSRALDAKRRARLSASPARFRLKTDLCARIRRYVTAFSCKVAKEARQKAVQRTFTFMQKARGSTHRLSCASWRKTGHLRHLSHIHSRADRVQEKSWLDALEESGCDCVATHKKTLPCFRMAHKTFDFCSKQQWTHR